MVVVAKDAGLLSTYRTADSFLALNCYLEPHLKNLPMTVHPTREPNERDPLLQAENGRTDGRGTGPMEISRSTRHGILAGIWVATFLTVSQIAFF